MTRQEVPADFSGGLVLSRRPNVVSVGADELDRGPVVFAKALEAEELGLAVAVRAARKEDAGARV